MECLSKGITIRNIMKKRLLLLSLLTASQASADRLNIDLKFDEEGKARPEFSVPYSWNENFFSSLGYTSSNTTNTGGSQLTDKSATIIQKDLIKIGLLGYRKTQGSFEYSGSVNFEYLTLNKSEFGYGELSSELFVIDNNVEITSQTPSIDADITYKSDGFSFRTGASISIGASLDVEQETEFRYLQSAKTKHKSMGEQDASYSVYLESLFNLTPQFGIAINAEYGVLPLDYTVSVINADLASYSEVDQTQEDSTLRYSLLFVFGQSISEMSPSIGITHEEIKSDNGNSSETFKADYVSLGFDQRF